MGTKAQNLVRKRPRQARARATVDAILEATVQVLEREGAEAATTTRIAAAAGVSVGTLYQYFSHRDALLDALQDREFARAVGLMGDVLSDGNLARTPRETVTAVVRGLGSLYAASPALHRVLTVEGLRVVKAERVHAFDVRVVAIIRHFLAATGAPVRRDNLEAASFVAFQAVRAAMLAFLLERPPGLDEASLERELVDLVLRYLIDDARLAGRPPADAPASARSGAGAGPARAPQRRRRRAAGAGAAGRGGAGR